MSANDRQVAGDHYGHGKVQYQHWDMVTEHGLNYFEGQITKYVMRCRKKNGKQDLEKAKHFLEKYLEVYDQIVPRADFMPGALVPDVPSYDEEMKAREYLLPEGYKTDDGGKTLFKCVSCRQEAWGKYASRTAVDHLPGCPHSPGAKPAQKPV